LVPDKGLGILIVHRDEFGDSGLQFSHAGMRTALDPPLREQREPAFNLIQLGGMRRREMPVASSPANNEVTP
jgi:hypothetical protein